MMPKQFLKNISLQKKQTLIIMLTSGAALLLACIVFVTYDVLTFRRAMVGNLSTLAEIVGNNSIAALDFDDPKSAGETLSALRAEPNIESGCIYTKDGQVFAVYDRPDNEGETPPPVAQQNSYYFKDHSLHLFRKIEHKGETVGTVYVESDLRALYSRLERYAVIVLGVFCMASLVAFFLSNRLQKIVSGPILHLVQTARVVAREKNFSMRAVKRSTDELGALEDSFNEMLSEIQLRDAELQKSKDVLEDRVRERTSELATSLSMLHATLESTADGILVTDGEGRASNFNEHFIRMWQIPREVANSGNVQRMLDIVAVQLKEPEKFLGKVKDLFGHPETESFDLIEFKDGKIFERTSKPQKIGEKSMGRVWSFRDITGRKRAESILKQTEELYRRAIAGADAVPYSYDYKTRAYLFMGEGIEQLIGYAAREVTPQLWKHIIQESAMAGETVGLTKEEAARRVTSGEIRNWRCDMRVITRDGKSRWLSDTSVQNLDESRRPTGAMGILQDITERKEAEQALRDRDEKFNQLADNITDVFWMRSADLKEVHYVSPAFERIWGIPAQTHYSQPQQWMDSIVPADRERVQAAFSKLTQDSPTLDIEYQISRPDGELRWVHVRGFQVRNASGKLVRLTGIVTDITERKQAEIAALAFSKLGKNLSSAATPEDAARIISEVAEDLLRWDACYIQMYSETNNRIYSLFDADTLDGKRITNSLQEPKYPTPLHQRILKGGSELILRDNPDSFLPGGIPFGNKSRPSASLMYVPIRFGAQSIGILSIQSYRNNAFDDHDLKTLQALADQCGGALERIRASEAMRKSESQFRLVWESSADGMRLSDRDGTVLMANNAYCRMVEKTKAEVEGKNLSIFHWKDNQEYILKKHREEVVAKSFRPHLEKEVLLWNGKTIWFELSNSLLELPGQPLLMLTIFRDITQRKQAEAELEIAHQQLIDTSRHAGMAEVATSVLHNVGNVLNSVNVSSSLIRERIKKSKVSNLTKVATIFQEHDGRLPEFFADDPKGKQLPGYLSQLAVYLNKEQEEVLNEVGSLVNNIEHIKEIVAMQQSYAKVSGLTESIQVIDLVEDALRMNGGALDRHQIQVIREYSETPCILVEKHKVLQILINLIRNAKYACDEMRRSDKHIKVRVTTEANHLNIAIIDNGVGIPPENLTRIFNHGFTTRKDGHGFGLHSGALAAIEIGGSLNVSSEGVGKGAEFTLKLPVNN